MARLDIAENATVPEEAAPPVTTKRPAVWQDTSALVGGVLTAVVVKNETRPTLPGVTRTVVVGEQHHGSSTMAS